MTIKEAEEHTGLTRSNIRFYEKEKLIDPSRNENNGYRNYSETDIEDIKKIAYLRTLGISIEDIRNIISEKAALHETLKKQNELLEGQITDLKHAKNMCQKMLADENITYQNLKTETYVSKLEDYWNGNQPVFKLDSVSFLSLWGSFIVWAAITVLCLATAILSYAKLPPEIPIQWNNNAVSSLVNKNFIFAYPAVCAAVRYLLRPVLYTKLCTNLQLSSYYRDIITEYLSNYLCFIVLSVEIFSILFIYGIMENILLVLFTDTAIFIGLLVIGSIKIHTE